MPTHPITESPLAGSSIAGTGVGGVSGTGIGVWGQSVPAEDGNLSGSGAVTDGVGVRGDVKNGRAAILGQSSGSGLAAQFIGDVEIRGHLTGPGGDIEERIRSLEAQVAALVGQVASLEWHTHTYQPPGSPLAFEGPIGQLPNLIKNAPNLVIRLLQPVVQHIAGPDPMTGFPVFSK